MGYMASHIATVPTVGFKWYLIFLEGSLRDPVKREIDEHFHDLGYMAGPRHNSDPWLRSDDVPRVGIRT
jgi:hypothetical protein